MALTGKTVGYDSVAATQHDLYTVPSATNTTGRVIVANLGAVQVLINISIAPAGAADDPEQYIAFELPLDANDVYESSTFAITATDKVRVESSAVDTTFTFTGIESS